ncbi:group 1 truncated hemoglobin [Motiliproteus sp. SC1-56]|uniref:group I truncated hemoglobin n=1 Tax=Motiliproteus sp. SC1-56 TaxID=2799565 RepID=UPI001A8E8560|nr:group 1 truncated hemoglobin [Motiliproteus sp. SC1-56]
MTSLYERMGAEAGLERAVEIFYQAVLADPLLAHFFDGIDMERQRYHQRLFLRYATGGDDRYQGQGLGAVHRRLVEEMGLNNVHFNAVLSHLESTLLQHGLNDEDVQGVLARIEALRPEVLGFDYS